MRLRRRITLIIATTLAAALPPVGQARAVTGRFTATSKTAYSITGDLVITSVKVTGSLGITQRVKRLGSLSPDAAYSENPEESIAALFGARGKVELYGVTSEKLSKRAINGGFCGDGRTTFLITMTSGDDLHVASFSGRAKPGITASENSLCGVYGYQKQ